MKVQQECRSNFVSEIVKDFEKSGIVISPSKKSKPSIQKNVDFLNDILDGVPLDTITVCLASPMIEDCTRDLGAMKRVEPYKPQFNTPISCIVSDTPYLELFALMNRSILPSYKYDPDIYAERCDIYFDLTFGRFTYGIEKPTDLQISILDFCDQKVNMRTERALSEKYNGVIADGFINTLVEAYDALKVCIVPVVNIQRVDDKQIKYIGKRLSSR